MPYSDHDFTVPKDDPNGEEAGKVFLEANKAKDGVVTLPSGLQYRVLEEGAGLEHPTVGTPCECHYAGRLLDGTEFDSSYNRGTPSTFAPNQVIKGWTEAMQLMVQGDKWEMYIPFGLAYGANGKPPKIPPAAALIFVMEIVKIKGETKSKQMTFPMWTPEELTLWLEKDEAAVVSWREARSSKWEAGDAKLTETYPTRDALDAWLDKQSKASKDKSLWKRTRTAQKKAGAPPAAGAAARAAPTPRAELTKETARALLDKVLAAFKEPANKAELLGIAKKCDEAGPEQAGMMRMVQLLPAVQKILTPALRKAGFGPDELMGVAMQIQAFGPEDATIATDTAKLMKAVQGDLSELL
jgi:FKBP-type peptidyl-prolyl cis-trans isomerase FklB